LQNGTKVALNMITTIVNWPISTG